MLNQSMPIADAWLTRFKIFIVCSYVDKAPTASLDLSLTFSDVIWQTNHLLCGLYNTINKQPLISVQQKTSFSHV